MFKIIVDSTADYPKEEMESYNIGMVPLIVTINDNQYKDKVSISVEELYEAMKKGQYPKTSQPNPQDIYDEVIKAVKQGQDIIFITLSAKLSGTYQCIRMVCEEIQQQYPERKMEVIDSKGGSAVSGIMAIQAAKMRDKGLSFDEVVDVLHDLADHGEHIFTIDDLKNLIRSGRINKTHAILGNLLNIKPILHVEDGEIKLFKKVHGRNKSLTAIVDIVFERVKNFPQQIIGIMHAASFETALELKKLIVSKLGDTKTIIEIIGSALGSHLGIGGVGVMFFNKKPKVYFL